MSTIGNRVFTKLTRATKEQVEAFRGIPSSNINDEMNRLFNMNENIRLLNPETSKQLLGTAFTVRVPMGDNLFFHEALDRAQPGDVIVVEAGGYCNRSLAGEIMMKFAQYKGIAGIVVDGCMRDADALSKMEMPIYCVGITPQGPYKNGPGEIGTPVAVGGQVVFPGDILVGDADGIVVIHKADADLVAEVAKKKKAGEDKVFEKMDNRWQDYAESHLASTAKRFAGREPEVIEDDFCNKYGK